LDANSLSNVEAGSATGKREALSSVVGLARLLLSLAIGTIVLSGTLLQAIYVGRCLLLLEIAWILLAVSLFWGYRVHARYITQLNKSELEVRKSPIERFSRNQVLSVAAGLIFFAIFVVVNIGSGPRLAITRLELGRTSRSVAINIDCRSGSDSGCRGEVVLAARRSKRHHEIGRALFVSATDGPLEARVPLPPRAGKVLAAGKAQRMKVEAVATGRFGNQTEVSATLRLARPRSAE
jgi:hypothetical protein